MSYKFGSIINPNWTPPEYSTSGWIPVPHYNPVSGQYYNDNLPHTFIIHTQQYPFEPVEQIPINIPMNSQNCSCYVGTPYIDNSGNCACRNNGDAAEPTPPIKTPVITNPLPQPSGQNCAMDAKKCPDGKTWVSRNPNKNCAFDDCPPTTNANTVNVIDTIKNNPLLAAGVAVGIYLLLKK